jgi:fructokinase
VCAVGSGPDDLRAETRFPTTTPTETLAHAIAFFQEHQLLERLAAIGVGSFGPVDLNPRSATYGYITSTPKPGWGHTNVVGALQQTLMIPVHFDTDVNAAALGEHRWGAAQGCDIAVYLTIGTGIGGGVVAYGRRLHGVVHPEIGHMHLPHDWQRDPFPGACPYQGDCLEGLASGPALARRWGQPAETLAFNHPAWVLQAHYLALALVNLICTLSPERIIIGAQDWRDPFVLWNEAAGEYWMLLAARTRSPHSRGGCVGLCVSRDLKHWEARPPVYASNLYLSALECPDLFRIGDWWYLVYSTYNDRFVMHYRMSRSITSTARKEGKSNLIKQFLVENALRI